MLRLARFYDGFVAEHQGSGYEALVALDGEWANLYSPGNGLGVLDWLMSRPKDDRDAATLLAGLTSALAQYMDIRGWWRERVDLAEDALARSAYIEDESTLARLLHNHAVIFDIKGQMDKAGELYRQALDSAERLGDERGMAAALHELGRLARNRGQMEEAGELYRRSLEIEDRLEDQRRMAATRSQLGLLAEQVGDLAAAEEHLAWALEIFRRLASPNADQVVWDLARVRGRRGKKNHNRKAWPTPTEEDGSACGMGS